MVALLFGQFAYAVHKGEGGTEVGKFVVADEVVGIDDLPVVSWRQHAEKLVEVGAFKRRDAASAGDTVAIGKGRHEVHPRKRIPQVGLPMGVPSALLG